MLVLDCDSFSTSRLKKTTKKQPAGLLDSARRPLGTGRRNENGDVHVCISAFNFPSHFTLFYL